MLDLVIPDSGPLITLGAIDRLDLINRFKCGILIADMVGYEIMRGPDTARSSGTFGCRQSGRTIPGGRAREISPCSKGEIDGRRLLQIRSLKSRPTT